VPAEPNVIVADHFIPICSARSDSIDSIKRILRFRHGIILSWLKEKWRARGEAPDVLCLGREAPADRWKVSAVLIPEMQASRFSVVAGMDLFTRIWIVLEDV
jgi:hypothetical protein